MKLLILGPPGSGKGTHSRLLKERLQIPQISTGDILREASAKKTRLGLEAEKYMAEGKLVPDALIIDIVDERLGNPDCKKGYILDGFPRTVAQAEALDQLLNKRGEAINGVVNIQVDDGKLISRLSQRRMCPKCGETFHLQYAPPRQNGLCDRCGGGLIQRSDDNEKTIENRLRVYREQTAPVVDYYRQKGVLRNIDGNGEIGQISDRIARELRLNVE